MPRKPTSNDNTTATPHTNDQDLRNVMAAHDIAESANNNLIELGAMFQAILELSSVRNDSLLVSLASIGIDMVDRQFEVFSEYGCKARSLMREGDHV